MKHQEIIEKPSILIADDNRVIIRLLGDVLTREGYQVTEVTSGPETLAAVFKAQPDLLLLDVDMPGLSGFDVCRKLKQDSRTAEVPVLFVTARNDKQDIVTGFAAGGQDYVTKPFTRSELLARVKTHLALRMAQQKLKASEARYRELAIRDDLTGFFNTRYLYQTLQGQLDMHRSRSLSVIFMDIDNFKKVVDTYGHLNGSRTIAELADVTRSVLPDGCYGVSYGGDEFVIVLAGHTRKQALLIAELIRTSIEQNEFLSTLDLAIHITVSLGVATFPDDAQTLTELLACADHSLFEIKKHGKNAVGSFL
ncbi:MAG: diguanylate cyclase [Desulfobulbaceae bacterium]|nr:diguanylate cyclase [Desulfobulbaceae bacterium]